MERSIRKSTFKSNALAAVLGATAICSLIGTVVYHIYGWPTRAIWSYIILVAALLATKLLLRAEILDTKFSIPEHRSKTFFIFNIFLFALIAVCFIFGLRHPAAGWVGSPWQAVGTKYIVTLCSVIALTAYGIMRNKITTRVLLSSFILLLSLNALFFPRGFGFDVFVHDATVRGWLSHGTITPITPLYNGFHALIALLARVTHLRPLSIISWLVPLLGATILASVHMTARASRENFHKVPYIFLAFFIIFNSLFTTSTPQALGHLMLFGLVCELWLGSTIISTRRWILRSLIAVGIATIHPLSGIPALAVTAWMMISRIPNKKLHTLFYILVGAITVLLPTLLLVFGAHGVIKIQDVSLVAIHDLFIQNISAFDPFVLTHLAYKAAQIAPFVLGFVALFGFAVYKPEERRERRLFILSLLLVAAAILMRFVQTENVIIYEQSAFATRILIAAYMFAIPLGATGFTHIWTRSYIKIERYALAAACVLYLVATWYVAYPAWNTETKTKAINTSSADFEITSAIDIRAAGKPYIVLADQPTSAAALYSFGFFDRQLPSRNYYFYPIPTGAELYTNYFLNAMYQGSTEEILRRAATFANVKDVFVVIKPYWTNANSNSDLLKTQNAVSVFTAGGATIGYLHLQ